MANRTVSFTIGGEQVEVPALTWDIIEDVVMPILEDAKARRDAGAPIPWWKARGDDIRILAAGLRKPYEEVRRALSMEEATEVSRQMNDLLALSGFVTPGEAPGASDSTETSTASSDS